MKIYYDVTKIVPSDTFLPEIMMTILPETFAYIYIYIYIYIWEIKIIEKKYFNKKPLVQLVDYLHSQAHEKTKDDAKYKISLLRTKPDKDFSKPTRVKNVYGVAKKPSKLKTQKQSEDQIIKKIKNLLKLKKRKWNNQRGNN